MYAPVLALIAQVVWRGIVRAATSPTGQRVAVTAAGHAAAVASNNMIGYLRAQGVAVPQGVAEAVPRAAAMLAQSAGQRAFAGDVAAAVVEQATGHRVPTNADLHRYQAAVAQANSAAAPTPYSASPPSIAPLPMPSNVAIRPTNAYQGPNPMIKPPETRPQIQYGNPNPLG
ncbi:hypothetical protein ACFO9E_11370 [Streptomyces maoxianensis]|uniref:Uncharacterized protein n=1 Tax=Streptomyces maoxianensis TaxID=1459942 RepID=A0ABV9G2X8_9ACTN